MAATKSTTSVEGRAIAVPACDLGVSRGASIRPSPTSCLDYIAIEEGALTPELSVTLDTYRQAVGPDVVCGL
ncbi:hypothetical protein [Streptomyces scabiei]|uniref:hypothetical protein n=1 Tax=Streptomyces scabiei TaxID=1930 RepID=UPI0004E772D5|nr:hypothetical protein [Streptomyces scabiei]KFG10605.1 hypothetical protein IQ61_01860 [Streptomyces scabiei]